MDGTYPFSVLSFSIAAGATAVCCVFALWALRSDAKRPDKKPCGCACACDRPLANGEMAVGEKAAAAVTAERQVGGSMMEQLVPEITTHALSYLDYTSLCRLSMTNSAMRRAANDDGAWKALYHKDFTVEQDSIIPLHGWKAYYAATKAIISINAEFYNIIRERSLPAMSRFWLHADYVKCIHGSGELFTGEDVKPQGNVKLLRENPIVERYNAVIDSWALAFNWVVQGGQGIVFEIRDVSARVLSDMAWVTMKAYVEDAGPFHVTNIYEFHNGRWYMVHHHSSVMLGDDEPPPQNIFG